MKRSKKYFIYHGDITEGIFDSQVLFYLSFLKKHNHNLILICFLPLKHLFKQSGRLQAKIHNIKQRGIKCLYFFTFNPMKGHGRAINFLHFLTLAVLFKIYNMFGYLIIIHARGIFPAKLGRQIKRSGVRCRLIFDMRSEKVSEYEYQEKQRIETGTTNRWLSEIKKIQKTAIMRSDICLMISHALKNYVIAKYDIEPKKCHIIPSVGRSDLFFFDKKVRNEMRSSLGLDNKYVIGYSGSMNLWQRVDIVYDMYNYISKLHKKSALLILTKDISQAKQLFDNYEKNDSIIIKSIDYNNLGKYQQCFDVGVILREKLLFNKISSPTKFSEYILCGVPVFISTEIGDLEKIVRQNELGICIEDYENQNEFETSIKKLLNTQFNRNAIANFAKKRFSREAYIDIYKEIYSYPTKKIIKR